MTDAGIMLGLAKLAAGWPVPQAGPFYA